MKQIVKMNRLQALCLGCLAVPVLSFLLGMFSAVYPFLVFALSIAGGGVLWVMALKVISDAKHVLDSRTITAVASASAGGVYGYMTGLVVGNQGEYPQAMLVVAFGFGLMGATAYRSYYRDLEKSVEAERESVAGFDSSEYSVLRIKG